MDMRRILVVTLVVATADCGTRTATIAHATLAVTSLVLAARVTPECDADGWECDNLGADVQRGILTTAAIGFAIAAGVSFVLTPEPRPACGSCGAAGPCMPP